MKLDIEGEEFNVLKDISGLPIRQILVEIHTPTKSEVLQKWLLLCRLWLRGYRQVAKNGGDYTFVRRKR
ncbi:FkbM family methyltransferase [Candidatus Kaiserbacteria bacterium]|nr:FkbM family methyltransferase [Candidatus Kaiserbacteria bacterium]